MALTTRRLFTLVFVVSLVLLTSKNVTDPDSGWHLRTGEYILSSLTIPHNDLYSYTAAGQPWVTHEWLAEAAMYLVYQTGGNAGLIIFFALVATTSLLLLYQRCPGRPFLAGFVVVAAALASAPFLGSRPHTLSLLFASATLWILDRHRNRPDSRILLWLVPLMVIWANSHGSFLLELALIGAYLAEAIFQSVRNVMANDKRPAISIKPLAIVFLVCAAAIALNPNGLGLYIYPLQTLNSRAIQSYIQEWQAPDLTSPPIVPFLLLLLATAGALTLSHRRMRLADIILLLALTFASLKSARQISVWVLVDAPILACALMDLGSHQERVLRAVSTRRKGAYSFLNWGLFGFAVLAAALRVIMLAANQPIAESEYFPVAAVNYINREGLRGPVFNRYDWGGYLIWRLYPKERVFIDGRSDLYGLTDDSIVEAYLNTYAGAAGWREPLERYHVNLVIVDPKSGLAQNLALDTTWRCAYSDDRSVVFARN